MHISQIKYGATRKIILCSFYFLSRLCFFLIFYIFRRICKKRIFVLSSTPFLKIRDGILANFSYKLICTLHVALCKEYSFLPSSVTELIEDVKRLPNAGVRSSRPGGGRSVSGSVDTARTVIASAGVPNKLTE